MMSICRGVILYPSTLAFFPVSLPVSHSRYVQSQTYGIQTDNNRHAISGVDSKRKSTHVPQGMNADDIVGTSLSWVWR
jgi:hypothetical protein